MPWPGGGDDLRAALRSGRHRRAAVHADDVQPVRVADLRLRSSDVLPTGMHHRTRDRLPGRAGLRSMHGLSRDDLSPRDRLSTPDPVDSVHDLPDGLVESVRDVFCPVRDVVRNRLCDRLYKRLRNRVLRRADFVRHVGGRRIELLR